MSFTDFAIALAVSLAMGILIGLERQYRQHPAGLRTNALVCLGAALFVSLDRLTAHLGNTTRMAPYVVSGIGFLGGGVILRDGMNVKGMSTAATLWCTAAVGVLAGSGFPGHAIAGAALVLILHLTLRPLGRRIDAMLTIAPNVESLYRLRISCEAKEENQIRALVARHVNDLPKMVLRGISTQENAEGDRATIVADIFSPQRDDHAMQELMSRVNSEASVHSVRWDAVHAAAD